MHKRRYRHGTSRSARALTLMRLLETLESRVLFDLAMLDPGSTVVQQMTGESNPDGFATSAAIGGLTPSEVRNAYGIDQVDFGSIKGDGTGQTIAIIDPAHNGTANVSTTADPLQTFGVPHSGHLSPTAWARRSKPQRGHRPLSSRRLRSRCTRNQITGSHEHRRRRNQ